MTTLTKEQIEELEQDCPMDNIGFDINNIDGRGKIDDETEVKEEE